MGNTSHGGMNSGPHNNTANTSHNGTMTNGSRNTAATHGNTMGGANNNHGVANGSRGGANGARGGMTSHNGMGNNGPRGNAGNLHNNAGNLHNNAGRNGSLAHRAAPSREIRTRSGQTVHASFRGGHVRTIEAHNMRIERGMHGQRRVVMERNGRRIVTMGHNRGFVQRPYYRDRYGRAYVQRTYYYGGRRYAYAYRTYYYGGSPYYYYAPPYYYHPAYYGWASQPWPAPAYYNWQYQAQPWYGYYGPNYYQPAPSYPAASNWLSDYSVGQYLKSAYEARQNNTGYLLPQFTSAGVVASLLSTDPLVGMFAPPSAAAYLPAGKDSSSGQGITPEVKKEITEELQMQLDAEKNSAATPNAAPANADQSPVLDPKHHIFLVASNLTATTDSGDECDLNPGDVLYRTGDTAGDDNKVDVTVKAAQKDDCAAGTNTAIAVDDLQEMQNHLREEMDAGLKELAANQGKNGLPAAPDTATTAGEVPPPAADNSADKDLQQAQTDADQTENEVQQSASADGSQNQ
jgi:hypothetical protein